MKSISSHVEDFMHEYPFLSKFLRLGVVNYRALARQIEPDITSRAGQKVSVAAISISLQRIHTRDKDKIHSLIGRLRGVNVVTGVSAVTIPSMETGYGLVVQALQASGLSSPFCRLIQGHAETTLIVEAALKQPLMRVLSDTSLENQCTYDHNLTALTVTRELLHETEVAALSYPLQVLAEHGIKTLFVTATLHEETIIVAANDSERAVEVIRQSMAR